MRYSPGILRLRGAIVLAVASAIPIAAWQLREPEALSNALGSLQPDRADVSTSLTIVDAAPAEDGSEWVLRLRNDDWRTITAWAVDSMTGTDEGAAHVLTRSTDRFLFTHDHDESTGFLPLRPGEETRFVVPAAAPIDTNPNRFAEGSYAVASLQVSLAVFDDGTFAGNPPAERLHDFYVQRLDQLQALATFHEELLRLARGRGSRLEDLLWALLDSARPKSNEPELSNPPLARAEASAPSQTRLHAHTTALIRNLALRIAASHPDVASLSRPGFREAVLPVASAVLQDNRRLLELGASRMPARLRAHVNITH